MTVAQIDLIHMISNAGLIVQFVLLLLLFFSITSWAIILVKYRYIKRAFKQSAEFTEFFWKSRDHSNAYAKAKQLHGSPLARIFRIRPSQSRRARSPHRSCRTVAGFPAIQKGFAAMRRCVSSSPVTAR